MAKSSLQKTDVQTRDISMGTASVIVVLFAITVFGSAILLAHPSGQQLLGMRIEAHNVRASFVQSDTELDCDIKSACGTEERVDCIQAPCPGDDVDTTNEEPVINCIQAPCPGGELAINTKELPVATAGVAYTYALTASGGSAPYSWSVSNNVYTGITVDAKTGVLTGLPKIGTHKITVRLIDAEGLSASKVYELRVLGQVTEKNHPAGTLVLGLDNEPTSVELIVEQDGKLGRKGFPNAETFISHGYKWEKIVHGNAADQALPWLGSFYMASGSLIEHEGTVYVVYPKNVLRGFANIEVFQAMGYDFSMVVSTQVPMELFSIRAPITQVEAHAPGTDVVNARTSRVSWITEDGSRLAYPSVEVYNSWHTYDYDFSRVVPENRYDALLSIIGMMDPR
jgi:hypothetical protein